MRASLFILFFGITVAVNAEAKEYVEPPSESTSTSTPYIPDEEMERCVELYNEIVWVEDDIRAMQVDRYVQAEVDAYNEKVSEISEMTDDFNMKCAGKQSESAYKATQKLNQENG